MTPDREWALAWANFHAFKNHLPNEVEESHVHEYHEILQSLQNSSGEDTSVFRIPDDKLAPKVLGIVPPRFRGGGGFTRYSDKKICDRGLMIRKLEAVEAYFKSIEPPQQKSGYGFT